MAERQPLQVCAGEPPGETPRWAMTRHEKRHRWQEKYRPPARCLPSPVGSGSRFSCYDVAMAKGRTCRMLASWRICTSSAGSARQGGSTRSVSGEERTGDRRLAAWELWRHPVPKGDTAIAFRSLCPDHVRCSTLAAVDRQRWAASGKDRRNAGSPYTPFRKPHATPKSVRAREVWSAMPEQHKRATPR